jgi:hypothetical protein
VHSRKNSFASELVATAGSGARLHTAKKQECAAAVTFTVKRQNFVLDVIQATISRSEMCTAEV